MSIAIPAADAYGGVLIDEQRRVLLREPTGHFGGYVWTFAKGRPDAGETPVETALREVIEETGYSAEILGALPQLFVGTTSTTSFFLMRPVGSQATCSDETLSTKWVTFADAAVLILATKTRAGQVRDLAVLDAAHLAYGVVALSPRRKA